MLVTLPMNSHERIGQLTEDPDRDGTPTGVRLASTLTGHGACEDQLTIVQLAAGLLNPVNDTAARPYLKTTFDFGPGAGTHFSGIGLATQQQP